MNAPTDSDLVTSSLEALVRHYHTLGPFSFELSIDHFSAGTLVDRDAVKHRADIAILLQAPHERPTDMLLGIEVKDHQDGVNEDTLKTEYEGYTYQFDEFYMATPAYREGALRLAQDADEIGLIDTEKQRVIEPAVPQPVYTHMRERALETLHDDWQSHHDDLQETYPGYVEMAEDEDHVARAPAQQERVSENDWI